MTQQRPNESDEEYEKRKRRVRLTMMGSLAHGGGGIAISVVTAAIIYEMDTFNVDTLLRTIDNAGSDGATSDGDMYGSNHIDLQATMSVAYTTVNTGDYGYFDVATKAHVKATATGATATLSSPTHHSNFFSLKAAKSITAGDLTYLDANPEAIARLVDGETVAGLSFVLADIEAFYPCNEGNVDATYAPYIAEVKGTSLVSNTDPFGDGSLIAKYELDGNANDTRAVTNGVATSITWGTSGQFGTASKGILAGSRIDCSSMPSTIRAISFWAYRDTSISPNTSSYVMDVRLGEAGAIAGYLQIDAANLMQVPATRVVNFHRNGIYMASPDADAALLDEFVHYYWEEGDYATNPSNGISIGNAYVDVQGFFGYIDQVEVWSRPLTTAEILTSMKQSKYAEITNYASTCRTNLDLTNYGASNFLYTQDATGRWTGMAESKTIEFNGDGRYVDTGWIPSYTEPCSVEMVIYLDNAGTDRLNGVYENATDPNLAIGQLASNDIFFRIGSVGKGKTLTNNRLCHVVLVNDGASSKAYIDGSDSLLDFSAVNITTSINGSFYIGNENYISRFVKSPIGIFKSYENKAMTAAEVATAYSDAKVLYPTLP